MRSSEEVRYEVLRTLTMLKPGGEIYLDLLNDDPFVQMLMRRKLFETAVREIEERDGADLPPNFVTAVITAHNLSSITLAIESLPDVKAIGPYQRRNQTEGLVSMFLKIPSASAGGLIKVLGQINRVRSAKKEPLLTYRIAPYDLDS